MATLSKKERAQWRNIWCILRSLDMHELKDLKFYPSLRLGQISGTTLTATYSKPTTARRMPSGEPWRRG